MKIELKKLAASILIRLTVWVLPEGKFRKEYNKFIVLWLSEL